MIIHRLFAGLVLIALAIPSMVYAQENVSGQCTEQVYQRLGHEDRYFRSVVFGQKKAADLPTGSVRYDKEFDTWIKKGSNQWRTVSEGNEGLTWSDTLMDEQGDVAARNGLVEWRKTPTSDLIPAMVQSFRALQCRLRAVCLAAAASQQANVDEEDTVKIQPEGCLEFEMQTLTACTTPNIGQVGAGTCDQVTEAILAREEKMLQLVVTYDAAYRTLLQFAGTFEGFMDDFRFPLLDPLWQMVRTMGALDNLPCFTAQCNE